MAEGWYKDTRLSEREASAYLISLYFLFFFCRTILWLS
jgi:hypothetical protein